MKSKLLILCFLSFRVWAQELFFLLNYTDKLDVNIKSTRNAVVISSDYTNIRLVCGNRKIPSKVLVVESIKRFLAKSGVPATLIFSSNGLPARSTRKDFYDLL